MMKYIILGILFLSTGLLLQGCATNSESVEPEVQAATDNTVLSEENQSTLSTFKPADAAEAAATPIAAAPGAEAVPQQEPNPEPEKIEAPVPHEVVQKASSKKTKAKVVATKNKSKPKASSKGFFKTTRKNCNMRSKPKDTARVLTLIPKGRKIWVEKAGGYFKVFRTDDVGYISKACF